MTQIARYVQLVGWVLSGWTLTLLNAQAATTPLAVNVPEIVRQIDAASSSLRLYAPYLRQKDIAQALRRARVERKVELSIVGSRETLWDSSSFTPSLALAGARFYTPHVEGVASSVAWLLIDDRILVQGNLLGLLETATSPYPTYFIQNPRTLETTRTWFQNATGTLPPVPAEELIKGLTPQTAH